MKQQISAPHRPDPKMRRGATSSILLVAVALAACVVGGIAAVVLQRQGQGPVAVRPAASEPTIVPGGGGAGVAALPADYAWLPRSENILAVAQGATAAPPPSTGSPAAATPVTQPSAAGATAPPEANVPEPSGPAAPAPTTRKPLVPLVVNKDLQKAQEMLQSYGLGMKLKGKRHSGSIPAGRVVSQWPNAGSVSDDGVVYVTKSMGPLPKPKPKPRVAKVAKKRSSGRRCIGDCSRCPYRSTCPRARR